MSWCPYRELGLARGASIDDVKKAFKELAKAHHPDLHHHLSPPEQSTAAERFRVGYFVFDGMVGAEATSARAPKTARARAQQKPPNTAAAGAHRRPDARADATKKKPTRKTPQKTP